MSIVYFIVGSSGSGKSTVERNLRLRVGKEFSRGIFQEVPEQNLVFSGRVLYSDGSRVLRLSGGDTVSSGTLLKYLSTCEGRTKIIYEKACIPFVLLRTLRSRGYGVSMIHLESSYEVVRKRLINLNHPSANKSINEFHAFRPLLGSYRSVRDEELRNLGIPLYVVGGSLRKRCREVEKILGVVPYYDFVVYDFRERPVSEITEAFFNGGDPDRSEE